MPITQLKKAFFGQPRSSSRPELRDIWLSTLRLLNISLEKSFKYTFVSVANWLILLSLGLWLVGHPIRLTKAIMNTFLNFKTYIELTDFETVTNITCENLVLLQNPRSHRVYLNQQSRIEVPNVPEKMSLWHYFLEHPVEYISS